VASLLGEGFEPFPSWCLCFACPPLRRDDGPCSAQRVSGLSWCGWQCCPATGGSGALQVGCKHEVCAAAPAVQRHTQHSICKRRVARLGAQRMGSGEAGVAKGACACLLSARIASYQPLSCLCQGLALSLCWLLHQVLRAPECPKLSSEQEPICCNARGDTPSCVVCSTPSTQSFRRTCRPTSA